ncbi:uncharacterized protein LOC143187643 [Calliopsis andreniformis]|uniref:uncharacterized protein LOC143187643 n=1 Tax=Calliopsis andreniformis TaxID=337506 RepID=UPI003FCDEF36
MLHLTTGHQFFLDFWDFSTARQTGEAVTEVVNDCCQIAKDKYNIKIYAVVTDNASNMTYMGKRVNLWHLTCNSHSGNLLFKSLTIHLTIKYQILSKNLDPLIWNTNCCQEEARRWYYLEIPIGAVNGMLTEDAWKILV